MNRPAGTVVAWWASPVEFDDEAVDAKHPCIPLQRGWEAPSTSGPFRARMVRVLRRDVPLVDLGRQQDLS